MKKKLLFIINPKSGTKRKTNFVSLINSCTDKNKFDFEIRFTERAAHATEISRDAVKNNFDVVVAIGGDGTVNEVAKGLSGTQTALGIIPAGSGNGMARHLGISMNFKKAFAVINTRKVEVIDTLRVNEEFCLSTCGIGFDGHIAHLFSRAGKRGFSMYAKLVLKEFNKYKPLPLSMSVDGEKITGEYFLLTFANSSQFGNNAVIAPFADVQDGMLDVTFIKKFPALSAPKIIRLLFQKKIHQSKYFETKKCPEVIVDNNTPLHCHIDGEPVTFTSQIQVKIIPRSLNILTPHIIT